MVYPNVKIREKCKKNKLFARKTARSLAFSVFPLIIFAMVFNACRAPQVKLRTLAPENPIVYLETNDLGKVLQTLVENPAFQELADEAPNFSALGGVRVAIAVTGFETSENLLSDENSVLNFTPRFVAVAETDFWEWQTVALVEKQLGDFVVRNYGAETQTEKSEKWDGKFFRWTAKDDRAVFAFVRNSRIYFGNDAAAIERCATRRDDAIQNSPNDKFAERSASINAENNLAIGYVSAAGIKQIADFAGVFVAAGAAEDADAQNFTARILPTLLRNTTEEIVWTATMTGRGIEDDFQIYLKPEIAAVAKETLTTAANSQSNSANLLPAEFFSATRYNVKNPLIAWRSLLVLTAKNTDALSGNLLRFSGALLAPYGIGEAETFLDSIDSEIITVQFDENGERGAAIFNVKDLENLKKSITPEIDFQKSPTEQFDQKIWFSEDKQTAAAFAGNQFVVGDGESVLKCLEAKQSGNNFTKNPNFQRSNETRAVAATFAKDVESINALVEVLATRKNADRRLATFYTTETRFTEKGIERKTVSDFGLVGTILKQLK